MQGRCEYQVISHQEWKNQNTATQAAAVLWLLPLWQSVVARALHTAAQRRVRVVGPVTPGGSSQAILEEPHCLQVTSSERWFSVSKWIHVKNSEIWQSSSTEKNKFNAYQLLSHHITSYHIIWQAQKNIFCSAAFRWWPSWPNGR